MLSSAEEVKNSIATGWLEKDWINLETDILPTSGTGNSIALALHHNIWDLILGEGCSLELSEMVLKELGTLKRLKRNVSSSTVLRVNEDGIKNLFKIWNHMVQVGSGLVLTSFPWTKGKCVIEQQNALLTRCE